MRIFIGVLVTLLVLIQYPLWLGKGGWLRVWELDRQHSAQVANNARLSERNAALEGEVRDLATGTLAVEERARYELGMIRPDEIFVQVNEARAQRLRPAVPDSGSGQTRTASGLAPAVTQAASVRPAASSSPAASVAPARVSAVPTPRQAPRRE